MAQELFKKTVFVILLGLGFLCFSTAAYTLPVDQYEYWKKEFEDILKNLEKLEQKVETFESDRLEEQVKFLNKIELKLDSLYKRLPTAEQWVEILGALKHNKLDLTRAHALLVMNQMAYLRTTVASKLKELERSKDLAELKNLKNSLLEQLNENERSRFTQGLWLFAIIVTILLIIIGLGIWVYNRLSKDVFYYVDQLSVKQRERFDELHEDSKQFNKKIELLITEKIDEGMPGGAVVENDSQPEPEEISPKTASTSPPPSLMINPEPEEISPKTPLEELTELYNITVHQREKRGEFKQRYNIITIGILNPQERAQNAKIEPIFEKAPNGEFIVVEVSQDNQQTFVVVPKFSLTFSQETYQRGSLGYVFTCDDCMEGREGAMIFLKKPAEFKPDTQKRRWKLVEKGEITLNP